MLVLGRLQSVILIIVVCLVVIGLSFFSLIQLWHTPWGESYPADLQALADRVWAYLLVDDAYVLIAHDQLNMNEERHLLDVKKLLDGLFEVWSCSGFIFLSAYLLNQYRRELLVISAKVGLGLLALLFVLTLILGFRNSFVYFHHFFFARYLVVC